MKKQNSKSLFSGLPRKARVLGAKFVNAGGKQSIEICYQFQGKTFNHSILQGEYNI